MDHAARFEQMYTAFNARDADAVLAFMAADVEWPKAFKGGFAHGRNEVRAYWLEQWAEISPTVTPRSTAALPDGRVDVEVDQTVRALDGQLIDERVVHHLYTFDGQSIVRMEIAAG
jgi:hypothetical protein